MTGGERIRDEVSRLIRWFTHYGIAVQANVATLTQDGRREVVSFAGSTGIRVSSSVASYSALLRQRQYSLLMYDGGLLWFEYAWEAGAVAWHRLLFFACPIVFSEEELAREGLIDLLDGLSESQLRGRTRLLGPVRFDYSPGDARVGHSASHVHLHDDSRIPCSGPVPPGLFARFVLEHFYRDRSRHCQKLMNWRLGSLGRTAAQGDLEHMHISSTECWR